MELSTERNYYKIESGTAKQIIDEWMSKHDAAYKKSKEIASKFGGKPMAYSGCPVLRSIYFDRPRPSKEKLKEMGFCVNPDNGGGYYPRSSGSAGKALCAEFNEQEKLCESRDSVTKKMFNSGTGVIDGRYWVSAQIFSFDGKTFYVVTHKQESAKPIDGLRLLSFEEMSRYVIESERQKESDSPHA